jgi:hypothetical protein
MFWRRLDTTLACTFLEDLHQAPWTLVAGSVAEVCADRSQAEAFLRKHVGNVPRIMLAGRWAGVEIPTSAKAAIERKDAWFEPPHLWIEKDGRSVFAWRLFLPEFNKPAEVEAAIGAFAARLVSECGCLCNPVLVDLPVPELGNGWIWHRTLKGCELHFSNIIRTPIKPKTVAVKAFVRGDEEDEDAQVPDIKDDWIASENFTFYVGRPKAGKSLAVAKTAAYITAGGTWDGEGKWTSTWFDGEPIGEHARGSVIIGEQEDKVAQTKARCRAAGCNMSKVHIRRMLPDISVTAQLKEWTDLAEKLGDCRMMAFSPIQDALKIKDNAEAAVRRKFDPIISWAQGRGIALIGVLHTNDDGTLAGSDVLFRVVRCVIEFADGVMLVRNSNIGPTGMRIPFAVEKIVSKDVKTARIVFGSPHTATLAGVEGPADASVPMQTTAATEPPGRRYTDTQLRYIRFLARTIPPITAGGIPMAGPKVREQARGEGLTNVEALFFAADALGIERRRREGAAANEADLWAPPSEYPPELDGMLAKA